MSKQTIEHHIGGAISMSGCCVPLARCIEGYNGSYSTTCPCDYLAGYVPPRYPVPAIPIVLSLHRHSVTGRLAWWLKRSYGWRRFKA